MLSRRLLITPPPLAFTPRSQLRLSHVTCNRLHCVHVQCFAAICGTSSGDIPLVMRSKDVTVSHRLTIDGAALAEPWVPREVIVSNGTNFIELSKSDRKLHRFIGFPGKDSAPLAGNEFFDELARKRNDVVDEAVWQHLLQKDPLLDENSKQKIMRVQRSSVDEADLPGVVEIDLPEVAFTLESGEELTCDAISIKCLLTLSSVRKVAVEASPAVLKYIRAASLHAAQPREKRPWSLTDVKGARCDKRRKTVYLWHEIPGSRPRRLQKKKTRLMGAACHQAGCRRAH